MKKKIIIPLMLVLSLSLAACGKDENTENTTESTIIETIESTDSSEPEEIPSTEENSIDLGSYDIPSIDVDDTEVDEQINYFLSESTNRKIANGDTINVSYTITNGENVSSFDNVDITIGDEAIAPGIDEKLKGQVAGYSSVFSIASSDGNTVDIDITINSISPQLTSSYIQDLTNGECKTEDELKEYLKTNKESSSKIEAASSLIDNLKNNITLTSENETDVADEVRKITEEYSSYGDTMKDVAVSFGYEDENVFNQYIREQAEDAVKEKLVYQQLAKDMNISVSEEDINNYKSDLLNYYTDSQINEMYSYDELTYMVLQDKVFNALFD